MRRRSFCLGVLLLLAPALAPTAAAASPTAPPASRPANTLPAATPAGDGTVRLTLRGSAGALAAAERSLGSAASVHVRLPQLSRISVEVSALTAPALISSLAQQGVVATEVHRRSFSDTPNDPEYAARQSGYLQPIDVAEAWDVTRGSASVRVAVVDSGVDVTHPDLAGKIVGRFNAVTGTSNVRDTLGHGTFVAGVAAAATGNGAGVAGVGRDASILAVKISDSTDAIYSDAEAAGIVWAADHGADVINLSIGSTSTDQTEADAIRYAQAAGVLVVAAAGNESTTTPSYPAALPDVVAVGATTAAGTGRASFSNHGDWVTVAAPGIGLYSTTPVVKATLFAASYDSGDGTSFSSPLVAGEAALLMSAAPSATADQVRRAIVTTSSGLTGLGLGAGLVDVSAALYQLAPSARPVITAPGPGATVSGGLAVSATTVAPKVRFVLDGAGVGGVRPAVSGSADAVLDTYGYSDATHDVGVAACSSRGTCGTAATVPVSVQNGAPVVSSPAPGQAVGDSVAATADAGGGGVAFYVDGSRLGFDPTPPYSAQLSTGPLADGNHTLVAYGCNSAGTRCGGPRSAAVAFTVTALHPVLAGATSPFSPNGDGRRDTSTVTLTLPDTEDASWQVLNTDGTVFRESLPLGTLPAGSHTFSWAGDGSGGQRAVDGRTYVIEVLTTSSSSALTGRATRSVTVDLTAPSIGSARGGGQTFYPVVDRYRDRAAIGYTIGGTGSLSVEIRNSAGTVVRTLRTTTKPAGSYTLWWDGKSGGGVAQPAGAYTFRGSVVDMAGNRRSAAQPSSLTLSRKALVNRTSTLVQAGSLAVGGDVPDATCAGGSTNAADTRYPGGLLLYNDCDSTTSGLTITAAYYDFTLPAAVSYTALSLQAYGRTTTAANSPTTIYGAVYNQTSGAYDLATPDWVDATTTEAWRTVAKGPAAGHVVKRHVVAGFGVTNRYSGSNDHDLKQLRLVVTYKVLQ